MPKIGREVITPDGNGPVTDLNIVKETVFVRLTNGDTSEIKEYALEAITSLQDIHTKQEQARKQQPKEEKEETESSTANIQNSAEIQYESHSKDGCIRDSEQKASETPKGREREKNRKGVLGQPVRRENPNRKDNNPQPPVLKTEQTASGKSENIPSSPNTGTNWADALEKAMQAIGKDN